jgi:hypothetical protein
LSCINLAHCLRSSFELTDKESSLVEVIDLCESVIETGPQHHPSRGSVFISLSYIYLESRFSRCNTANAIRYMLKALSLSSINWFYILAEVAGLISLIDPRVLPSDSLSQLLQCLSAAIDLAFRTAGFMLDSESQLQRLRTSHHLGPRAFWCATKCGQPRLGLELIEHARAIMWTQSLQMRSPQLSGAPSEVASELERLLTRMNGSRVTKAPVSLPSKISSASHLLSPAEQDSRYRDSTRIHQLIE